MSENLHLFAEEEMQKITIAASNQESALPLIPLAKKRQSKNDSPLEKEMRRFNKLIKELHEYEEGAKKKKEEEEEFNKMYLAKVMPLIKELSKEQVLFVKHVENIFYKEKNTKSMEKRFVSFVIGVLHQAATVDKEALEISQKYLNRQVEFMSKSEKKAFSKMMDESGFKTPKDGFKDFDFKNFMENQQENFDFESYAKEMHESNAEEAAAKKHTPISVADLYKELVKILHPDLEQDEKIKQVKEQLMKELTVAKEENDLHAMLILKQKAHQLNNTIPNADGYSLEKLKAYNKVLKQKIEEFRFEHKEDLLSSMIFNRGHINLKRDTSTTDSRIKEAVTEIKDMRKGLASNLKMVSARVHVIGLIASYEADMEDDFDDEFFGDYNDFDENDFY